MREIQKTLQAVLDKTVATDKVFGTSFAIEQGDLIWSGASGDLSKDQSYFIASTTKLFTTAMILQLQARGDLALEDRVSNYLDESVLLGLHLFKGQDYSRELTIKELLAHTSGLPDYFQGKGDHGKSLEDEITQGYDQSWTFDESIERTKKMRPLFAPGTKNKAHYSDANFQLLGRIIEVITHRTFCENCIDLITGPLGLEKTYLYQDPSDKRPKRLYYKEKELIIPKAMVSFGADGAVVSTSADMLVFIEGFFTGRLFPLEYLSSLQEWNRIFYPMRSGIGIHLFRLPWLVNPAGSIPYFIGHSGLSGALAFYSPKENLYIAGTVNQVAHPDISFKTMIKLAQVLLKGKNKSKGA